MKDPFPFDSDTLTSVMRDFLMDYRRITEETCKYDKILDILAVEHPQ